AFQRGDHAWRIGPVIVVAEDGKQSVRRTEAAQAIGKKGNVLAEADEVTAQENQIRREPSDLRDDLGVEIAAHEPGHMRVGEKGDAITVKGRREVIDEDLVLRDLQIVNLV